MSSLLEHKRAELERVKNRNEALQLLVTDHHNQIAEARERVANPKKPLAVYPVLRVLAGFAGASVRDLRTGQDVKLQANDVLIPPTTSYAGALKVARGARLLVIDATRLGELERIGAVE